MKYYIEVFNHQKQLKEWSTILTFDKINTYLEWAKMYLKGIATIIRVYSHDGLHRSETIREVDFIDLQNDCEWRKI